MKRLTFSLLEELLEKAHRLGSERTCFRRLARALDLHLRRIEGRQILELGDSGAWSGDLGEMRGDLPTSRDRGHAAPA